MPANYPLMNPCNPLLKLGLCLSLVFFACQTDKVAPTGDSGSGAGPRIFRPDGTPAAGARVQLVPVDNNPKPGLAKEAAGIYKLETNADGKYDLTGVPAGEYNVFSAQGDFVALQDSVRVNDGPATIKSDTLAAPGTLSGIVALQPNHNSNSALVQLLGTTVYTNVGEDGRFEIGGLAAGSYAAVITTSLSDYSALFTGFNIKAGARTDRKDTLRPPYQGIPTVLNITATYDTLRGVTTLTWNKSRYRSLLGYVIYRDAANTADLSTTKLNRSRITDTVYRDTVFPPTPFFGTSVQADVEQKVEYRVAVQAKNGDMGQTYESVPVNAEPPSLVRTYFRFQALGGKAGRFSIKDSVKVAASYTCSMRSVQSLRWSLDGGVAPVRTADGQGRRGTDTLIYVAADKPETRWVTLEALDEGGATWRDSIRLDIELDAPSANAGIRDTFCQTGKKFTLSGTGQDGIGRVVEFAWDVGGKGAYVTVPDGKMDITAPDSAGDTLTCILRVTDDDGISSYDTTRIFLSPAFRSQPRPFAAHAYLFKDLGLPLATDGKKIYAYGGFGSHPYDAFTEYDPELDKWKVLTPSGSLGVPITMGGKIYVTGSADPLVEYNPSLDKWKTEPFYPYVFDYDRFFPVAVECQGKLIRMGIQDYKSNNSTTVEIFDPIAGAWKLGKNSPQQLTAFPTITSVDGKVYLFNDQNYYDSTVFSYDLGLDAWSELSIMSTKGERRIVANSMGKIFCYAVRRGSRPQIEWYDITKNTWNVGLNFPENILYAQSCGFEANNGRLYFFQGQQSAIGHSMEIHVYEFDPDRNNWRQLPGIQGVDGEYLSTVTLGDNFYISSFVNPDWHQGYTNDDSGKYNPHLFVYPIPKGP